jgi:hypothetical protein
MSKIKDYTQDSSVALTDKLIGTDSSDDSTKSFSVSSLNTLLQKSAVGIQALSGASVDVTAGSSKIVVLTESSGSITVNLHTAVDNEGIVFIIVAENGNDFTIDPYSTETIDGSETKSITTDRVTIVAYDGNWLTLD